MMRPPSGWLGRAPSDRESYIPYNYSYQTSPHARYPPFCSTCCCDGFFAGRGDGVFSDRVGLFTGDVVTSSGLFIRVPSSGAPSVSSQIFSGQHVRIYCCYFLWSISSVAYEFAAVFLFLSSIHSSLFTYCFLPLLSHLGSLTSRWDVGEMYFGGYAGGVVCRYGKAGAEEADAGYRSVAVAIPRRMGRAGARGPPTVLQRCELGPSGVRQSVGETPV